AFRSYGTGYVQLSNAKWVDSQNLKVTATPCQNGSGSIHVVASNCVSANSFYLKLDGDRHGPAGDDYPIPITVSSDQTCYNALAMFEGCFAWPEADGIHIGGYIPWHQGTTGFRIYGDQFHQTVLKEVGDASALNPYWFETVVPGPPRAFYQVAELTAHGEESLSPIIKCGSPPENLAVLRMTNQRSQLQPPFASTSIDKLPDNDGSSTAAVTDFVVLVPDTFPQFQSAIQPVVSAWQASGKTVQVWSISKDLNQARKLLKSIHDAAVSNGIPPDSMPQVQIIGGPLTTLGPIYTADSTGSCLFGNCASILNIADFNGDGRADMPVMQLPVDSLGQLQNADQTKLQHMQTYLHPVGPSLFAYGDIPGYSPFCAPLAEPAATLRGIETQVNILGQPTISIRQSQFSPDCSNYDSMQTRMVAMMNGVISSSQGMAYYTNRSIFDVMLRRVDMAHPFTISMLRRPQVIWINAFGCDMADILRVNPYAPTPAEQLLHANPNINTAAVSIIGNLRAGYLFEHLEYARLYNKNAASGRFTTNAQVLRQTQQDLCDEGLCEYAQGIVGLGWIADLPVYHTVVSVEAPAPGDPTPQLWLGGPNPFSSQTTLRYVVSRTQPVNLTVIDVGGRAIKTLVNTTQPNGVYAIDWNGTDNEGRRVASSVYFVKLAVGNKSRVVKLTLLH
ncbi:MAG: T9SS type A sorting domain-containing protein, partial [Candidatus Kerfeldbacteria bacterium]|nr:T9SS type A sorting domain-containing protein [Candidatus Kerfeldbacteria bacterium]